MTPTEFLLARLDEDERIARQPMHSRWSAVTEAESGHIDRHDPARVLAEVQAKRRIMEEHLPERPDLQEYEPQACRICYYDSAKTEMHPCPTLRLLALPYADHPDYDESWRT